MTKGVTDGAEGTAVQPSPPAELKEREEGEKGEGEVSAPSADTNGPPSALPQPSEAIEEVN